MTTVAEIQAGRPESAGATAYAIEVEGVRVHAQDAAAEAVLSMHVPYGSVYGLVGRSGAGKSETIRTLATVQPPLSGIALVGGHDVQSDPAAVRSLIGYLPDASGVYEGFTLREQLEFYAEIYGVPARRRRQVTNELLELVGLIELRDSPVETLTRGQKQQLALARSLIHDPTILLLDEPAAGMDPLARLDLRDILHELRRLGKTVLLCSHLLAELAEVCTHVGIMDRGRLLKEGAVDEIMALAPDCPTLEDVVLHVIAMGANA